MEIKNSLFGSIIVLGGMAVSARGENLFEQIGWKGATSSIIVWLTTAILGLLVILISLYVRSSIKAKKTEKNVSEDIFNDMIVKADLYPLEKKKLLDLLKHQFIPYRHSIFQSAALFERCVDAEVKLILLTAKSGEELDESEQILSNLRKKMGFAYLPLEHPLLSSRNIEIGQTVTVFPANGKNALINHGILLANKETYFRIGYKTDNNKSVPVHVGDELKLAFARQADGVYGLTTEVYAVGTELYFDCLHTLEFQRNQLRQYVRMEVNLPLRVRKINFGKKDAGEPSPKNTEVKLCDISGGGLSFFHTEPFATGDRISMNFTLTSGKFSGIEGKILRITNVEGKNGVHFRHHVQFINIEQSQRDRIIRFIFEKQRIQNQIR